MVSTFFSFAKSPQVQHSSSDEHLPRGTTHFNFSTVKPSGTCIKQDISCDAVVTAVLPIALTNRSAEAFGAGGSNGGVQVVSTVVGAFVKATALTDVTSIAFVSRLPTTLSGDLEENLKVT